MLEVKEGMVGEVARRGKEGERQKWEGEGVGRREGGEQRKNEE